MDAMVASVPPHHGVGTASVPPPGGEQAGDVAVVVASGVPAAGAPQLRAELLCVHPVVHGVTMTSPRRHDKHHYAVIVMSRHTRGCCAGWGGSAATPPGPSGARRSLDAVPQIVPLQVQVIARPPFDPPADAPWETDVDGGQALAEFAGRACYQSWSKPNPATATNAGYLRHIMEVGHLSVLEHGVVTFYLTGVSRSFTHELIRHRHLSYSQLSQRYVPERDAAVVEPDVIAADPELHEKFVAATTASVRAYEELLEGLEKRSADLPDGTLCRKQARQAARAVLPNATETRIVVTGNFRAWRHFIAMRATEHADVEIRALAVECLRQLQAEVANVFSDFEIATLEDGTEIASSPFVTEG